jgi:hypothetical protein
MSDTNAHRGPGPIGTGGNSPGIDAGTNARTTHKSPTPAGNEPDFFTEVFYYPVTAWGAKILRKGAQYSFGDEQGRYLLELWLSGGAPAAVTLDGEEWGQYMRAEPDLQEQIHHKLRVDAYAMRERLTASSGQLGGDYTASFHGEIGRKSHTGKAISGGYFTGYQILHGSKKTDTLNDVQIEGKFSAARSGASQDAYTVTYSELQFTWDDIINVNRGYRMDRVLAEYSRWEKEYTGGGAHPKDYVVHIKWRAAQPITIEVTSFLPEYGSR